MTIPNPQITAPVSAPPWREEPVLIPCNGEQLAAVLTLPEVDQADLPALVLVPAGTYGNSAGRNRVLAQLARRAASLGYPAVRFDYHGVGDSTGVVQEGFRLDRLFTEDVSAVVDFLSQRGHHRFVLLGHCFGARTAVACAASDPRVVAVIAQSLPLMEFGAGGEDQARQAQRVSLGRYARYALRLRTLHRLLDADHRRRYREMALAKLADVAARTRVHRPRRSPQQTPAPYWVSRRLLAELTALGERNVPILYLYGERDSPYADVKRAASEGFSPEALGPAETVVLPGRLHGLAEVATQQLYIDRVEAWLGEHRRHLGS